jgi:hypothetical protein
MPCRTVAVPSRSADGLRCHDRASWQRVNGQRPRPPGRGGRPAQYRVKIESRRSPLGRGWGDTPLTLQSSVDVSRNLSSGPETENFHKPKLFRAA